MRSDGTFCRIVWVLAAALVERGLNRGQHVRLAQAEGKRIARLAISINSEAGALMVRMMSR
jgi:hypothetical protein